MTSEVDQAWLNKIMSLCSIHCPHVLECIRKSELCIHMLVCDLVRACVCLYMHVAVSLLVCVNVAVCLLVPLCAIWSYPQHWGSR